ncbi:MAG TPA: DUF4333 domain-containing protein [Solirubrobacteraceae bacterium]|nr:DUF4333 domain-containing protein [Solirubrobacteraceae bacterium]
MADEACEIHGEPGRGGPRLTRHARRPASRTLAALVGVVAIAGCGGAGNAAAGSAGPTASAGVGATAGAAQTTTTATGGGIDMTPAEGAARTLVAQQTGADVVSVDCPRRTSLKVGAGFTCRATGADGTTAAVVMTPKDAAGDVALRPLELLQTTSAAKLIADALTHEYKATVTVQCPDLVSAHKNTQMTCHATDAGVLHNVVVTVKDNQGSLAYRLES